MPSVERRVLETASTDELVGELLSRHRMMVVTRLTPKDDIVSQWQGTYLECMGLTMIAQGHIARATALYRKQGPK